MQSPIQVDSCLNVGLGQFGRPGSREYVSSKSHVISWIVVQQPFCFGAVQKNVWIIENHCVGNFQLEAGMTCCIV